MSHCRNKLVCQSWLSEWWRGLIILMRRDNVPHFWIYVMFYVTWCVSCVLFVWEYFVNICIDVLNISIYLCGSTMMCADVKNTKMLHTFNPIIGFAKVPTFSCLLVLDLSRHGATWQQPGSRARSPDCRAPPPYDCRRPSLLSHSPPPSW